MGDSHANAVRQSDLDSLRITNFAFDTESYFDVYNKLHYLIQNHKVDTVYLCVDNHTLSKYRQSWTNRSRSIYYADYENFNSYYPIKRIDFFLKKYFSFYFPLFETKNSKILQAHIKSLISGVKPNDFKNFDFSIIPHERRVERSKNRIKLQFPDEQQSELLTKCLIEMIELCRSEEIELIGVKFPVTKEYFNELGDRSYKADSVFISKNLPVFDFTPAFIDSCNYFRDQDHLNFKGSSEFVKLFQ